MDIWSLLYGVWGTEYWVHMYLCRLYRVHVGTRCRCLRSPYRIQVKKLHVSSEVRDQLVYFDVDEK